MNKRNSYSQLEINVLILKIISKNKLLPLKLRLKAIHILNLYPREHCITKIKNICTITGRSKGNMGTHWKMSRIKFRELTNLGYLYGVRKSSW